jgi:hypothetical protein
MVLVKPTPKKDAKGVGVGEYVDDTPTPLPKKKMKTALIYSY